MDQLHPLLKVTEDDVRLIWKELNIEDEKAIQSCVDAIEAWCKKEDHLAEVCSYLSRGFLERMWISSRGSTEMCKMKIEKIFTIRGMLPQFCANINIDEFDNMTLYHVPLPNLNPIDHSRVFITQLLIKNVDEFNLLAYLRYVVMIADYRFHYDYCFRDTYIIDVKNAPMGILAKLNPIVLKNFKTLCIDGYRERIKAIHILNAPSYADKLLFIVKQGLKSKIANRIYIHSSYEELHKEISKEILPKDYEGNAPSCEKLAEQWKIALKTKEGRNIVAINNKLVTDETKRSSVKFNEEYLGMPGSFKQLTVD